MALEYQFFLEDDIDIPAIFERISEKVPSSALTRSASKLDASDNEGLISLWMRRVAESEIPYPEFVHFHPKVCGTITLDKEKRHKAQERLIEVVKVLLENTDTSLTLLMFGEILLLQRVKGQSPSLFAPDFWTDRMKSILLKK
jgi:hypothetical protein